MDIDRIVVSPRKSMTWEEFLNETPSGSIALDGAVKGGPKFDDASRHINFDHHEGVIREITMSTAMQVHYAIKGGLMESYSDCTIYINDTDQDVALAVWLLINHRLFEGSKSIPHMSRLLELDNRLDVTGGAFPQDLRDELLAQHNWVFRPYTELRCSGALANADESTLRSNLEAVLYRLDQFMMGDGGKVELNTAHELYYQGKFWMANEVGGNEARYYLWSLGMKAFINRISTRADGKYVYSIGKRSRYISFPVLELYQVFSEAEGLPLEEGWGGSDIIGGSSRFHGSGLDWEELRDITINYLSSC